MISENMKTIFDIGLVPLIVLDDANDAIPFGEALVKGGIPIAEVTFRTEACLPTIRAMAQHVPGLIVGAGTVHTVQQAIDAVEAGAQFIVTPAFNPAVTEWCVKNKIDILPGTVSPADIEAAAGYGLEVCKFFPAGAYGGITTLKALSGPFADIKFMPTGGVNFDNMNDYLDLPNVAAVGGSFMTPGDMVKNKDWDGIAATCQKVFKHLLGFELGHVGLHAKDRSEAEAITDGLCELMLQDKVVGNDCFFAGPVAEICYLPMPGANGHICIDTRDMERAMAYYKRQGVKFNDDKIFKDDKGNIKVAFLEQEIGGFTVHLRRKAK